MKAKGRLGGCQGGRVSQPRGTSRAVGYPQTCDGGSNLALGMLIWREDEASVAVWAAQQAAVVERMLRPNWRRQSSHSGEGILRDEGERAVGSCWCV